MKNTSLKRRIKKLLENKSAKFKRKYFMLSSLALNESIKDNEVFSKSSCYLDNLLNSNGVYPSEDAIVKLYKESLIKENFSNKDIDSNIKYIENFSNLLYSNKSLVESIIDDELSSILINNKRLDMKLKEVMLESFNKKISLFLEAESLDGYKEDEEEDLGLEDLDKEVDSEVDSEVDNNLSKKSAVNRLLSDYDFLFKVEKVPYIRNKLKFFIPVESTQEFIDKKIPITDKLSIIKKYDLIENKKASVKDLRKLEIIFHIDYFLNIKQSLIKNDELNKLTDDIRVKSSKGLSTFWQNHFGSNLDSDTLRKIKNFQATSSYIDPSIKQKLKAIRRALINKGTFSKENIDLSSIKEKELFLLLGACLSKNDKKFYMKTKKVDLGLDYLDDNEKVNSIEDKVGHDILTQIKRDLDIIYPIGSADQDFKKMSDDDYLEYLYDLEDEKDKQAVEDLEDKEKFGDMYLTPDEAAKADSDDDFYYDYKPQYAYDNAYKRIEDGALILVDDFEEDEEYIKNNKGKLVVYKKHKEDEEGNKTIIDYKTIYDSNGDPVGKFEFEEKSPVNISKYFKATPLKRRKVIVDELISSTATPAEMEDALSKYSNVESGKRKTYEELKDLSKGRFKKPSGIRQELNKVWFRSLFFSNDPKEKGNVYHELIRKFVEVLQKKDLFKNIEGVNQTIPSKISQEDIDDKGSNLTKDMISSYFKKDLTTASASNDSISSLDIAKYFSGDLLEEDEAKEEILDELLNVKGLFRHFSTSLMKEFYNTEIWSKLETELAHAIVEYFKINKPNSDIGISLPANQKAAKVKDEEGKALFDTIVNWTMRRTAVEKKGSGEYSVEQNKSYRINKFKNKFPSNIAKYNQKLDKYNQKNDTNIPKFSLSESELDSLAQDMSSDKGIIGGVYAKKRKLDKFTYDQFFKWINRKSDEKLSKYINVSLITSFYYKEGFILDRITRPDGTDEIVLIKRNNPKEIHIIAKEEENFIKNLASSEEFTGSAEIDIDSYKNWAEDSGIYKNIKPNYNDAYKRVEDGELVLVDEFDEDEEYVKNKKNELEVFKVKSWTDRNDWINDTDEVVYYDKETGTVYDKAEVFERYKDENGDVTSVLLSLNPDADNPFEKTVNIEDCTEIKEDRLAREKR